MDKGLLAILLISTPVFASEPLSLERYLQQVRGGHTGVQSAVVASQSGLDRSLEKRLFTSFYFFTDVSLQDDERPRINPLLYGNSQITDVYSFGFKKSMDFGLDAKLYYSLTYISVFGASPIYLPISQGYFGSPVIELKQDLWRNGFGSELKAKESLAESGQLSFHFSKEFEVKQLLVDGELTYWNLSLSRRIVEIVKETYSYAVKIREWNAKRVQRQLTDRADLLQSEANLKLRELDLKSAIDDEKQASREFNSKRGIHSETVEERLRLPEKKDLMRPEELRGIEELESTDAKSSPLIMAREDVRAFEQNKVYASAQANLAKENTLPNLSIYALGSLNSLSQDLGATFGQSLAVTHPAVTVGLNLSLPLDFNTRGTIRDGTREQKESAQLLLERKVFEVTQEWNDLIAQLKLAQEKLLIAEQQEQAQKAKLDYERARLYRGKTITFQVLQFETDYLQAQIARVRAEANVLRFVSALKLFRSQS